MCFINGNNVEYNNIFGGVKILITDEGALEKNEYKIPEYIESIIVYGYLYENKKEEIERLKNGMELMNAIKEENEKLTLEILERENININQVNKNEWTVLIWACAIGMESVVLKLLEREEINVNQVEDAGYTALQWACRNNKESVALKLLEREEIDVNHVSIINEDTALIWACFNKMENESLQPPS